MLKTQVNQQYDLVVVAHPEGWEPTIKLTDGKSVTYKIKKSGEHHPEGLNEWWIFAEVEGRRIGFLRFNEGETLVASEVEVDFSYQRQGIGSTMYALAESRFKKKFKPSDQLKPPGERLWDSKKRPFGIKGDSEVWYHGRTVQNEKFDLNYVGKDEAKDQEGPGFYFTTDLQDAKGYAHPNGIVLKVTLKPRKLVTGKANRAEVKKLMEMAPDLEGTLSNWDENPDKGFKQALEGNLKRNDTAVEAFQQVWYDFYRRQPKEYLLNMAELGYDGHLVLKNAGVRHMIVYNPNIIHVDEVFPYKDAT